jgi:transglutaminase-like putative cysteine protease
VPADASGGGELAGYHCWAELYLDGAGWVPVDASEAWKHPDKRDYFFGHHDANRVQLTTGRDVTLPGMRAPTPLNFIVFPYAEGADGKPVEVARTSSWKAAAP